MNKPSIRIPRGIALVFISVALTIVVSAAGRSSEEPSYERAVARWPDQLRPITFLGCKDHLDEFGVMWNGNLTLHTVAMTEADRRLISKRPDPSLQVSFSIGDTPDFQNRDRENGSTTPSLAEGYLPMTNVKIQKGDVTLLQEAFVSSEEDSCTVAEWNSPVFLRVRFTVEQANSRSSPIRLWAQLAKNHISYAMSTRRNVRILPIAPVYGAGLQLSGNSLTTPKGLVVMASSQPFQFYRELPNTLDSTALQEAQLDKNLAEFTLIPKRGIAVELVFPYLPIPEQAVKSVLSSSYESAQRSVSKCWKSQIERGMHVEVPEGPINNLWRFSIPLTFITADLYPNGDHILKTSSQHYEALWVTVAAINIVDLIQRGYSEEAAAYLQPFLNAGRRRPVPSDGYSFDSSDGFISGPSEHLPPTWVSDNGAILWAASEFYLFTRDQDFLKQWLPNILGSLEWIARERRLTAWRIETSAGLLPPSRATDNPAQGVFVWDDAWNYRGLAAACKVLKLIHYKDASRWETERDDYRASFERAFRRQIQKTIRWTDRTGTSIPFVPWELSQTNADQLHNFYLDAGPMIAGVVGLVDPNDESMTWTLKWFTEGPDAGTDFPDWSDFSDRPTLRFEMSSVEPCYSWNIGLRFMRNERNEFLEGFYSMLAGSVSRRFLGGVETRDGIQDLPVTNAVIDMHLRNMLVFENESSRGIELLRESPSQWLRPGNIIRVERAQTYFGPMTYRIEAVSEDRVDAEIELPNRDDIDWIKLYLYHPDAKRIQRVTVNGASIIPLNAETIEIKKPVRHLQLMVGF